MLNKIYFRCGIVFYISTQFLRTFATDTPASPSGSSSKASFQELTGNTLFGTENKVTQSVATLNWVLTLLPVFPSLLFMLVAGNRFKNQDFAGAAAAFMGSVVSAIASFLVHKMIN